MVFIFSQPSKSAIVLATFNILLYALALKPSVSKALFRRLSDSLFVLQYLEIYLPESSEFVMIPISLYLSFWILHAFIILFLISDEDSSSFVFFKSSYFTGETSTCMSMRFNRGHRLKLYVLFIFQYI